MLTLNLATVFLFIGVVFMVNTLTLTLLYMATRALYLRWWMAGFWAGVAGLLAFFACGLWAPNQYGVLGELLATGFHGLIWLGLCAFVGHAVPWRPWALALSLTGLALLWPLGWPLPGWGVSPTLEWKMRVICVPIAVFNLASVWTLLRHHLGRRWVIGQLATAAHGLIALMALGNWLAPPDAAELLAQQSPMLLVGVVVGATAHLMQGFGLVILHVQALMAQVHKMALTDVLTQLPNRRSFEQRWLEHMASAPHEPLTLALIDLDHFKAVNDQHGHAVGDQALREFALRLKTGARPQDWAARWGGEEFIMACPGLNADQAHAHLSQLLAKPVQLQTDPSKPPLALTASAGCATLRPREGDLDDALRRADAALYRAKAEGRHRVCNALPMAPAA